MAEDYAQIWGNLRSLLSQKPSCKGFWQIIKLLQPLTPEVLSAQFIPYTLQALEGWPSRVREDPAPIMSKEALSPITLLKKKLILKEAEHPSPKYGEALEDALASPYLGSIRTLNLKAAHLSRNASDALFCNPNLTKLELLSVSKVPEYFWLSCRYRSPHETFHLRRLDISASYLSQEALTVIATSEVTSTVRDLAFRSCTCLSEEGLLSFLQSPYLKGLLSLDLGYGDTTPSPLVCRAIAGSPYLNAKIKSRLLWQVSHYLRDRHIRRVIG